MALRVLIVDDDVMMAKTLRDILIFKGHQVITAQSASEALQKLAYQEFDCIFSDICMPHTNGVALYHEIAKHHPQLPVVLMTAYTENSIVQEGLDAGIVAVLTKPLYIPDVLAFLERLPQQLANKTV